MKKKLYAFVNAENESLMTLMDIAATYENNGADGLYIYNRVKDEAEHESFLDSVKQVVRAVDMPVMIGIEAQRFEDIKKAFYTGAVKVVIRYSSLKNKDILLEASKRFGMDRIALEIDERKDNSDRFFVSYDSKEKIEELGVGSLLVKHVTMSEDMKDKLGKAGVPLFIRDDLVRNDAGALLLNEGVSGIVTNAYLELDFLEIKRDLLEKGIETELYDTDITFAELKKNNDGMVPVVVQDYKSNEVLMLAYMNEEAYNRTIATGRMTYFSRSRNELWVKGESSGHFQYLKSLMLDCDKDTLLARVKQIGAACHTGNRSCFYTNLLKHSFEERDAARILAELYETVVDRKKNPKEGSYTNYLFDKGIDKILKKCGEEATEMVIAAKNPNAEELRYEIADFLYHMTVLMVECGLDWTDITEELAHRS